MKEFLKNILSDSDKLFSFYVIFVLSIVTIPITLKEAFIKEIKYYKIEIPNFPINEIASYQVSILFIFLIFLAIIHANKILILASDLLGLLIPFLERKLGINRDTPSQKNEQE